MARHDHDGEGVEDRQHHDEGDPTARPDERARPGSSETDLERTSRRG